MTTDSLTRSGGVTLDQFYDVVGALFNAVFTFLSFPIFGIPLYAILIGIAVVIALFALMSNRKDD